MNQWFILSTQQCSSGASFTRHLCTSRDPFCHLVAEQQLCFLFICPLVFFSGIFMSTCNVDVRWFPFDIQRCELKFGSWTYDGWLLDLQMSDADISSFMPNGEWDLIGEYGETFIFFFILVKNTQSQSRQSQFLTVLILPGVPGTRNEIFYDCCKEPYPAVTFVVTIRRRTLYYALNLLIPCVLLSSMTLLIFVLPADSGEKISLGEWIKIPYLFLKVTFGVSDH